MTLSILLSRIAQLSAEADAITREIADLTTRRADIRMVLAELGQIRDRAPLASVPSVAADIQLHPAKPPRARRGVVEEAVLSLLRADDEHGWSVSGIVERTGHDMRSVWAAVTRLVQIGEVIKAGRPHLYLYRANPHDKVVPLIKGAL